LFDFDGTTDKSEGNTNVWRARSLCAPKSLDGKEQRIFYNPGVGTQLGEIVRGEVFGYGIDDVAIDDCLRDDVLAEIVKVAVEDGAQVEAGDLIVEAGGKPITDADDLYAALASLEVPFEVKLVRGNDERTVQVGSGATATGEA